MHKPKISFRFIPGILDGSILLHVKINENFYWVDPRCHTYKLIDSNLNTHTKSIQSIEKLILKNMDRIADPYAWRHNGTSKTLKLE